jgi:hypothetical protein
MRIAALLNLTVPNSVVLIEGSQSVHAQQISEMTECRVIALNPSTSIEDSETVATVMCDSRIPFASDTIAGAACESMSMVQDISRVIRPGGRALLPVHAAIPAGLVEIARDDRNVLVESIGEIVTLRR